MFVHYLPKFAFLWFNENATEEEKLYFVVQTTLEAKVKLPLTINKFK